MEHTRAFLYLQLLQANATLRLLLGPRSADDGGLGTLDVLAWSDDKAWRCSAFRAPVTMAGIQGSNPGLLESRLVVD